MMNVSHPNDGRRNNHIGPVIIHDSNGMRVVQQDHALTLGWDGESPVMYIEADGSIRFVCPGVK